MSNSGTAFVAEHYGTRARSYVESATHSGGADLDQIELLLRERAPARVLDLGCGGGHVSYRAAPHAAEVVACDLTAAMLDAVAETAAARGLSNVAVRQAAAEDLPFPGASFDAVLCRFSTHHWQDMEAGLREARRVLRPGGFAVFVDTVAPADPVLDTHLQAVELLRDASHVRNRTAAEWVAALARAGLAAEGITPRRLFLDFAAWIARTRTEPGNAAAVRALLAAAPAAVRAHFAVAADGSFEIDTLTLVARPI